MKKSDDWQIYFIGIGGIGISGLARYFKANRYAVSGSDTSPSTITDSLQKEGIPVMIGHRKTNLSRNTLFVVYSRAIPATNPELISAKKSNIPLIPYAKVIGALTERYKTIAITGSHGKSTTTSIAALVLLRCGLDPTVLVGTNLKFLGGKNMRIGRKNSYLVLEADDFGAAFLAYSPSVSVITNIDNEHMDFYKNFAGVKNAFLKFIARTKTNGVLILNRDDATLSSLKARILAIARQKNLRVIWYSVKTQRSRKITAILEKYMQIPGEHNLSNAMAVYELGKLLKIPEEKIIAAISLYRGAWRRMEYRGTFKAAKLGIKIPVYDDYAHHPTEIKATLKAFSDFKRKLVCIFQPHQAKRLQTLFKEFTSAFLDADILVLTPFYKVAGRDEVNPQFTSERLAEAIHKKYPDKKVYYLANPRNIKNFLNKTLLSAPSCIVMMGAGDIVQYTDFLIK